jgi:hypothetical protein
LLNDELVSDEDEEALVEDDDEEAEDELKVEAEPF